MTAARLRWWAGGGAVVAATVAVAWALAHPELPVAVATARALSDGAAVTALGLAVVPLLDAPRYRAELIRRARRPLILVGAVWIVAESTRLTVTAAQAAGSPVAALSLRTAWQFATATTPGRSALFGIAAAAVVTGIAITADPGHGAVPRRDHRSLRRGRGPRHHRAPVRQPAGRRRGRRARAGSRAVVRHPGGAGDNR